MEKKTTFNDFTGQYSVNKTLRFKLIPVGCTFENILKSNILNRDEERADNYQQVKKIIDEFHKDYIEKALSGFSLKLESTDAKDSLEEYFLFYHMKRTEDKDRKAFEKIQDNLRKAIAERLTKNDKFALIFKEDLFSKLLPDFIEHNAESDSQKALIESFNQFTTYFTGFHQNRHNMYSKEKQSTAIAYRLIHENLPKFIDNIRAFEMLRQTDIKDSFSEIYSNFEEYLNVKDIEEMFSLNYFSMVLTQTQIDVYNAIIGGKSLEGDVKIKGLNEYINLYNQKHKDARLPKLKILFKQILSDRNAISWLPEEFNSDQQMLDAVKDSYAELSEYILGDKSLRLLLESLDDYDLDGIFIRNDLQLTDISMHFLGSWSIIPDAIRSDIRSSVPQKKKESDEAYQERIAKCFRSAESFSIGYINRCLAAAGIQDKLLEKYFATLGAVNTETVQKINIFARIANAYEDLRLLFNSPYPDDRNLCQDKENIAKIKNLLDELKALQHFIKPLMGKGDESDKDERFYGEFIALWNRLDLITPLYNKVRNYSTRKPYSVEKIKLNFDNSTLLGGWDINKEHDNTSVILRKDGMFYLAIMNKNWNRIFDSYPDNSAQGCYEKMEYKYLPSPYRMLPKVFFSNSRIGDFNPSEEILEIREKKSFTKGENFSLEDCHKFIDFLKDSLLKNKDWLCFDFSFSDTSTYTDISEFYNEVAQQGYRIKFRNISAEYINQLVDEGKLYLFQIYNKDFSSYSKGTPNMHTLYWKMLFDERNFSNVIYQLNGQAEIFFRKASIKALNPTHPAGLPIKNKNKYNPKKESVFSYDLVKYRRYTDDTFLFHVPITINFSNKGNSNINSMVNDFLKQNDDVHIIGIDRGERNLLYAVVIDKNGNIVDRKQISLNRISVNYNNVLYSTDYHELLNEREAERMKARKNWQNIENIKDMKEGFLSQAVHVITQLMVQYKAIVVLEDLSHGFMRGRQKVEKQVYEKFEKMLIEKLNFLADKKKSPDDFGALLHGYQLTNKVADTKNSGKQNGFLFYIPAWNTSKIDPVTGFVNLLDTRYESIEKAKAFIGKFDSIRYNAVNNWFEFSFDYNSFGQKAAGTHTKWKLCTHGTRIETFRNPDKNSQWDSREINLTEEFKKLFEKNNIDKECNLKEEICEQIEKPFFESLMHILRLTLQMRNSITGTDIDYLISPVADSQGHFFDSREGNPELPVDADANGAYNIARKGLWAVHQIKTATDSSKVRLAMTNKEWLQFAQEKPYLDY